MNTNDNQSENPLLNLFGNQLPPFARIKIEHMAPAIEQILRENRAVVATLVKKQEPSWDDIVVLEKLGERLSRVWSPIGHINSVCNSEELRPVYSSLQAMISDYSTEMGQNDGLFSLYQAVKAAHYDGLGAVERKIIDDALLGFKLSGIELKGEERTRYGVIKKRLSALNTTFGEKVMDATRAFTIHFTDETRLGGLPESILAMLKQNAAEAGKEGYVITLDVPCYVAVMTYADDRSLREELYAAYMTIASENGPNGGQFDNTPVMEEGLALKQELAQLLGFASYADMSLALKMASDTKEVTTFLEDLAARAHPLARREKADLVQWAQANFPSLVNESGLEPWDIPYFSEKLKVSRFSVSEEELRAYFPADKACAGVFAIVEKIYGIVITEVVDVETWHPDVKFFEICDRTGAIRGKFYLDLFARKNKRGGAWMDVCINRFKLADCLQIPVAYLTCNFAPAVGDQPALLRHRDVVTLLHEFGHGLHLMLTQADYPSVGMEGVEWDAIELPSQIMEFFAYEEAGLELLSGHYLTGEPLPADIRNNLIAAKNFMSAMMTVRQLEFALFDFRLHMIAHPITGAEIQGVLDQVRAEVAVNIPPHFARFQNSFSHIFAGGYAAGYYSYKWAELLAADAYAKFADDGVLSRVVGEEFLHNVLEPGSSKPVMELYIAYRGRKPTIDALLHYSGLSA